VEENTTKQKSSCVILEEVEPRKENYYHKLTALYAAKKQFDRAQLKLIRLRCATRHFTRF
jgi:hypothetical protein